MYFNKMYFLGVIVTSGVQKKKNFWQNDPVHHPPPPNLFNLKTPAGLINLSPRKKVYIKSFYSEL